jgi:phosphoserine phosphatase
MIARNWQPTSSVDAVIFDCDGTLSTIEGIDVLAEHNGVSHDVVTLTADAMGKSGMHPDLYAKRLNLVRPTYQQIIALAQEYFINRTEDSLEVIQVLKRLNKAIYIVSAGLYLPVRIFGELLTVPAENIIAVNIEFNEAGEYCDFDKTSSLVYTNGKRSIVSELRKKHQTLAFIGDGLNDIEAKDLVDRFIGYGGMFFRENIAARCQYYIRTLSLTPLLPLLLTPAESKLLTAAEKALYDKGLIAIEKDQVMIR